MVFRGICLLYLLAIFQTTYLHCRRTITDNERKENKSLMTANDVITQRKNADSFCYVTAFCLYHRNFNMTILSLLRPHRVHIRKQQELFFFVVVIIIKFLQKSNSCYRRIISLPRDNVPFYFNAFYNLFVTFEVIKCHMRLC